MHIIQEAIQPYLIACDTKVNKLNNAVKRLEEVISKQQQDIKTLQLDINSSQQTAQALSAEHVRYERANNLRLTGLEGTATQIKDEFIKLALEKMHVNILDTEIAVHVLTPSPTQTTPTTKIAVTLMFSNSWTRRLVYDKRMELRGTNVFVSDDLTKEQAYLLYCCRELRR